MEVLCEFARASVLMQMCSFKCTRASLLMQLCFCRCAPATFASASVLVRLCSCKCALHVSPIVDVQRVSRLKPSSMRVLTVPIGWVCQVVVTSLFMFLCLRSPPPPRFLGFVLFVFTGGRKQLVLFTCQGLERRLTRSTPLACGRGVVPSPSMQLLAGCGIDRRLQLRLGAKRKTVCGIPQKDTHRGHRRHSHFERFSQTTF